MHIRGYEMLEDVKIAGYSCAADAGLIVERKAQDIADAGLPAGLQIISADNHIEVTEDIFYEAFPQRLRDAAPRVWFDGYWRIGYPNSLQTYPEGVDIDGALTKAVLTEGFNLDTRRRHLEIEGISKEIVYPQSLLAFIRHPDQEVQELIYRIYNEYMAVLGKRHEGQFYGVGICGNWWDPAKAEASVRQIVDLGLKTFMLPLSPGLNDQGKPIDYAGEGMDRFWAAAAEAGLPVSFHIGEVPGNSARGGFGTFFIVQAAPFRRVFGNLIFGGILDRHPNLRIVFAEGGINWVPGALQDAELTYGAHRKIYDIVPKYRPSHYWSTNMYATFQTDIVGLKLLGDIGADRVMWAQDYPHGEGTFGYTAAAMREIINVTTEQEARMVLGGTAARLYRV
jgi:predicted TIM-barrel fold metal-dependent hydrolase